MDAELKPCPCCGQTPSADSFYVNQGTKWGGILCCIEGPEVRTQYEEWPAWKDKAIAAWNTRSPLPAAQQAARGVETLVGRIRELEAENARLREALSFYAVLDNYYSESELVFQGGKFVPVVLADSPISLDDGKRARHALAHQAVAEQNRVASRSELP